MFSNNIILIIIIISTIGLAIFFYCNYKNNYPITDKTVTDHASSKKKVRFNKKIKYNTYDKDSIDILSPQIKVPERNILDVDKILSDNTEDFLPSNLNEINPEDTWYSSFGLPLMSAPEKKAFINKMKKNHENYQKSMGEFVKYQTDDSAVIKPDIEPLPDNILQGKAIKDIYDRQVAGPRAKPKNIIKKTGSCTIYENESELNGGMLKGSELCGFNNNDNEYKSAAFNNEF